MAGGAAAAGAVVTKVAARFGRLWGRGYESFYHVPNAATASAATDATVVSSSRRILAVSGPAATQYLQGLVTSDLMTAPTAPRPETIDAMEPGLPQRVQKQRQQQQQSTPTTNHENPQQPQKSISLQEETDDFPTVEFSEKLRATCFLDNKGRIVSDSLLWKINNELYYIDCPVNNDNNNNTNTNTNTLEGKNEGETSTTQPTLFALHQHLKQYKLRRTKVTIQDVSDQIASHVVYGTLNAQNTPPGYLAAMDPRHPSLGMRILQFPVQNNNNNEFNIPTPGDDTTAAVSSIQDLYKDFDKRMAKVFPHMPGNYELVRRLAGVAEGQELTGRVALEANQEMLNAVSFHKGCYLGQELTARVNYTGVLRKRILPLFLIDTTTQVPQAWHIASSLQEGRAKRRFTKQELSKLPSRLPRLSVWSAGNLVSVFTGSVALSSPAAADGTNEAAASATATGGFVDPEELQRYKDRAEVLLADLQEQCTAGAKLVDTATGKTIGQIVAPPVPGTNVVLALMRLDAVGLVHGSVWSKTNQITIGETTTDGHDTATNDNRRTYRYLPYLPLWWSELHPETGKMKDVPDDDLSFYESEAHPDIPPVDTTSSSSSSSSS